MVMRPLVRCVTRSAHWNAPSESGIGRLPTTESLYSGLRCCARETHGAATAPAAAPSNTVRRVVLFMGISSEVLDSAGDGGFALGFITAGRVGQEPLRP